MARPDAICDPNSGGPHQLLKWFNTQCLTDVPRTEIRQGNDLKRAYLQALSHITVVHWPALLLLAVLAQPIVMVLMGQQWTQIVPLVQIISIACLFWFPMVLTPAILAVCLFTRNKRCLHDILAGVVVTRRAR